MQGRDNKEPQRDSNRQILFGDICKYNSDKIIVLQAKWGAGYAKDVVMDS